MYLPNRLLMIVVLLAAPGLRAQVSVSPEKTGPNIIFLFADDQRPDTIGAWGNEVIKTPNLDRLVKQGMSFRNNYCMGSMHGAVCIPSRAMVMSGKSYFRMKMDLRGVTLLPRVLAETGYTTFGTGKWHNGKQSFERAFDRGAGVFLGGMSDHTKVPVHELNAERKLVNKRTSEKFSSEEFADSLIGFLEGYDEKKPFFAYCAFTAPHDPRQPPAPWRDMYKKEPLALPDNFLPQHPFDNGDLVCRDEKLAAWPREESVVREQLAEYYGLISHLDHQIGRILDALGQSIHAGNTLIVFAADHGLAMGSHGLLGKQSLYEHSMRCPLILAGPGIPQGSETRAFTYLFDLFPTLCRIAGATLKEPVDGTNLMPLVRGSSKQIRDTVFLSYARSQRAVRQGPWKLIRYPQINHTQLFDLASDPHEKLNLAARKEHAGRVARLMALLKKQQVAYGDSQPLTVAKPRPQTVDLTGRERKPDRWQPAWIRAKYFEAKSTKN